MGSLLVGFIFWRICSPYHIILVTYREYLHMLMLYRSHTARLCYLQGIRTRQPPAKLMRKVCGDFAAVFWPTLSKECQLLPLSFYLFIYSELVSEHELLRRYITQWYCNICSSSHVHPYSGNPCWQALLATLVGNSCQQLLLASCAQRFTFVFVQLGGKPIDASDLHVTR
jgi:hypothetical protein